jgi:hypothetical protein
MTDRPTLPGRMQITTSRNPFVPAERVYHFGRAPTAARWIGPDPSLGVAPAMLAFRCGVQVRRPTTLALHVSADQRYTLYHNGHPIGRGPQRGDLANWFFETHELELEPGTHTFVSRVTWYGRHALPPAAQVTAQPGFLALAECDDAELAALLTTGTPTSGWEQKRLGGWQFQPLPDLKAFLVVGARWTLGGPQFDFGYETGAGDGWTKPASLSGAFGKSNWQEGEATWRLRPALLPALKHAPLPGGSVVVRHIDDHEPAAVYRVDPAQAGEIAAWQKLLGGTGTVTIPPHTRRRVLLDLADYACVHPKLTLSGGAGADVTLHCAEALFVPGSTRDKGNRNEVIGREFRGYGDTYLPDGGAKRAFDVPWYLPGRYLQLTVQTAVDPLTFDAFTLEQTHYPFDWTATFDAADDRLPKFAPMARRTLEMCGHETYFDCPYYEQLMYVGDTRLEVLTTYTQTPDDRLPRKAVELFDLSRTPDGLTSSRYPTREPQVIPTFSLWWVAMVHDFARWRDDEQFVRDRLPGVRAVLQAVRRYVNADGLIESMPGWNYVDWVPGWPKGMPPGAEGGVNGSINWQAACVFRLAADLEERFGETAFAAHNLQTAKALAAACEKFFDPARKLYAEDAGRSHFAEHAQCLAILSGLLPAGREADLLRGLEQAESLKLSRPTIYFSHYQLDAYYQLGRGDLILNRVEWWTKLADQGFVTTPEAPEPSRSDCHAWGAHPLYHFHASLLGIRPADFGFRRVQIKPQLGSLAWAKCAMPHPRGTIRVDLRRTAAGALTGSIELPAGVQGTFVDGPRRVDFTTSITL